MYNKNPILLMSDYTGAILVASIEWQENNAILILNSRVFFNFFVILARISFKCLPLCPCSFYGIQSDVKTCIKINEDFEETHFLLLLDEASWATIANDVR